MAIFLPAEMHINSCLFLTSRQKKISVNRFEMHDKVYQIINSKISKQKI